MTFAERCIREEDRNPDPSHYYLPEITPPITDTKSRHPTFACKGSDKRIINGAVTERHHQS